MNAFFSHKPWLPGVLLCLYLVLPAGCNKEAPSGGKSSGAAAESAAPVLVAAVEQRDAPVDLRVFGFVEANLRVAVASQITGNLMMVHFKEGQSVRKGDRLFSIDPRPFEAALRQAEANLARDKAQHENAVKEAQRQKALLEKGITSQDEYDTAQTAADALAGTLRADQAAIERATIDLGYCSIYSPMDARTGAWMVHPGNLVTANETILVVLNQVRPIQVSFHVPQENLAEIQKQMAARPLQVQALIPGGEDQPEIGTLTFVDNTVDRTTGMVQMKATFANPRERLWPGLYINVVMTLATQPNAVVVASRAIQAGQKGMYVFVVKADDTVEARPVKIDRSLGDDTVISQGLAPGERVVTDGQLRLVPGAKVAVKAGLVAAEP
ncbi:MAG: efflux RND transporter periplasmic adaptor subunit [Planctomycetota bacterium]|nr:efflux RND transporter periplasmic adaptor subunit [Planctomycetota bacterium]